MLCNDTDIPHMVTSVGFLLITSILQYPGPVGNPRLIHPFAVMISLGIKSAAIGREFSSLSFKLFPHPSKFNPLFFLFTYRCICLPAFAIALGAYFQMSSQVTSIVMVQDKMADTFPSTKYLSAQYSPDLLLGWFYCQHIYFASTLLTKRSLHS